jgi:hypothetical protein
MFRLRMHTSLFKGLAQSESVNVVSFYIRNMQNADKAKPTNVICMTTKYESKEQESNLRNGDFCDQYLGDNENENRPVSERLQINSTVYTGWRTSPLTLDV